MEKKPILKCELLGDFLIEYNGNIIDVPSHLGKQLINLFEWLLINHDKEAGKASLIEKLYSDSNDPANLLKFTVFRLRKGLSEIKELSGLELIITSKNGYQLNPEYEYELDLDQFSRNWDELKDKRELNSKDFKLAEDTINLYQGHLYLSNAPILSIENLNTYYRTAFAQCVMEICKYLISKGRYEEMLAFDYRAIIIEPFYEGLHYYYMQGLIKTEDYHNALKYYDEVNEAFYRELGTGLSPRFKKLYNVVITDSKDEEKFDIKTLSEDLVKNVRKHGGYYCTYDMFKHLYEVSVKNARREGKHYYLILFNLICKNTSVDKEIEIMNKLKYMITDSLRESDIFAKLNSSQFVALCNCKEAANTYIIIQRITNKFYKNYSNNKYRINYDVKASE